MKWNERDELPVRGSDVSRWGRGRCGRGPRPELRTPLFPRAAHRWGVCNEAPTNADTPPPLINQLVGFVIPSSDCLPSECHFINIELVRLSCFSVIGLIDESINTVLRMLGIEEASQNRLQCAWTERFNILTDPLKSSRNLYKDLRVWGLKELEELHEWPQRPRIFQHPIKLLFFNQQRRQQLG